MTREEFNELKETVHGRGRKIVGFAYGLEYGIGKFDEESIYYGIYAVDSSGDRWPIEGFYEESDAKEAVNQYMQWIEDKEERHENHEDDNHL